MANYNLLHPRNHKWYQSVRFTLVLSCIIAGAILVGVFLETGTMDTSETHHNPTVVAPIHTTASPPTAGTSASTSASTTDAVSTTTAAPSPPLPATTMVGLSNTHAVNSSNGPVSVYTYSTGQWQHFSYADYSPTVSLYDNNVFIGIPELKTVFIQALGGATSSAAASLNKAGNPSQKPNISIQPYTHDQRIHNISAGVGGLGNRTKSLFPPRPVTMTSCIGCIPFTITYTYLTNVTASDIAVFDAARNEITSRIPHFRCLPIIYNFTLNISVEIHERDGTGGNYGAAMTGKRDTVSGCDFPFRITSGHMWIDEDDWPELISDNNAVALVVHEIMHIMGIGVSWYWDSQFLYIDTIDGVRYYVQPRGHHAYWTEWTGDSNVSKGVKVEDNGIPGTDGSHWNENNGALTHITRVNGGEDFRLELMTGYLGTNSFVSETTWCALEDMGYYHGSCSTFPPDYISFSGISLYGKQIKIASDVVAVAGSSVILAVNYTSRTALGNLIPYNNGSLMLSSSGTVLSNGRDIYRFDGLLWNLVAAFGADIACMSPAADRVATRSGSTLVEYVYLQASWNTSGSVYNGVDCIMTNQTTIINTGTETKVGNNTIQNSGKMAVSPDYSKLAILSESHQLNIYTL